MLLSRMIDTTWRCGGASGPPTWSLQQLGALAQRGERGLQLVRQVAQEAVLLGLELGEPAPQPVEPLAERLQVVRAAHRDPAREVGAAELPDRGVELGDRPRDVPRERERDGRARPRC